MTKTTETTNSSKTVKKPNFTIEIDVLGKKWKQSGDAILEALEGFDMDYSEIKSSGFLTVKSGDKEFSKRFNTVQLRRIITNKIVKAHWARNLELLLS